MQNRVMDIDKCLFERRTIRQYSNEEIDDRILKRIITAGIYAPSACNFQAWKIIVIDNSDDKEVLINCYDYQVGVSKIIKDCNKLLVITYRNDLEVRGKEFGDYIQSAAACIQNMQIMAYSYGIGCCWMCCLPDEKKIKECLSIPKNYSVIAFLSLGYPLDDIASTKAEQLYHYGTEEDFKLHKRRFSYEQCVCNGRFAVIGNDSTTYSYPKKGAKSFIVKYFPQIIGFYQSITSTKRNS